MSPSPREVFSLFMDWARRKLCAATCRNYERLLERWLATLLPAHAAELKAFHLITWANTWHELQAVKRVFHWAAEDAELIERNPFKRVKLPPIGGRRRVLTRVEMARLMLGSRRDFRLYLLAMWHTLARPQEVREMCWEDLRWDGYPDAPAAALREGRACFVLAEFKARRRRLDPTATRVIAVPAPLGRLLAHQVEQLGELVGHVFRKHNGEAWTKEAVRLRMKRLRKRAGLGIDGTGEPVVCYSIRHTSATEASAVGVRDRMLADMMGHSTTRTTARYQHLQLTDLSAAARVLSAARRLRRRPPGSTGEQPRKDAG